MKLPDQILPVLRKVSSDHSLPIELWKASNGNRIMAAFSDLAMKIDLVDIDVQGLPKGYGLLKVLFRWETECQFGGWNAFDWAPETATIVNAYSEVGLQGEAKAIARAADAWLKSPDDYDAITTAYSTETHEHSVDIDRLEYLVDYFCRNAEELFYETTVST